MNKEGALETYEHDKYSKINETWNINMTIYCVRMIKHKTKEKQQIAAHWFERISSDVFRQTSLAFPPS